MIAAKAKAGSNQDSNGEPTEVNWGLGEMEFEAYMRMMDQAVRAFLNFLLFIYLKIRSNLTIVWFIFITGLSHRLSLPSCFRSEGPLKTHLKPPSISCLSSGIDNLLFGTVSYLSLLYTLWLVVQQWSLLLLSFRTC